MYSYNRDNDRVAVSENMEVPMLNVSNGNRMVALRVDNACQ